MSKKIMMHEALTFIVLDKLVSDLAPCLSWLAYFSYRKQEKISQK